MKITSPQDGGSHAALNPSPQATWQTVSKYARWGFVLFVAVWIGSEAGFFSGKTLVNRGGWSRFSDFWTAAVRPELSLEFLQLTAEAALVTFAYARPCNYTCRHHRGGFCTLYFRSMVGRIWATIPLVASVDLDQLTGRFSYSTGDSRADLGAVLHQYFWLRPHRRYFSHSDPLWGHCCQSCLLKCLMKHPKNPIWRCSTVGFHPLKRLCMA